MTRLLYEAMGVTETRFSVRPFPWRVLMACAHKGLDVTRVPVKLSDKDSLAFSGQTGIPVFVDGETVIPDSCVSLAISKIPTRINPRCSAEP